MERNCRRNLKREGINGIGCMWVFISLFGSNQKRLLMDLKRGSKRVSGNEMKQLTCSCESSSHESSVDKLIDDEVGIDVLIAGDEHVETTEVCKSLGDESEEKFKEIIKRLIAQKEGEIQTCKDLLEAFHVLGSEEESFMKKISSHEDAQTLGGDSKRVVEPEVVSKQEAVVLPKRKPSFFSRKWKSEERRNRSQVAKTIVVLKPGPSSLNLDSSSDPHSNVNKSKTGRTFSRFLIGLVKRRLQSAVGKKSCDDHADKMSQNCSMQEEIQSKPDKHIPDEEKPLCKERKSEAADEKDTDSEKIMSGLYIAAKKHLSEMLANGDIDVNLPDKEVPRILGKILSLPEFCSPAGSPKLNPEHDLVSNLSPLSQTDETPEILQCSPDTNDMTDEDLDKEDDTLFTIDVSVPNDSEKETENIDKEEKTEIDPISETSSSSISQQVENVDEDALEFREEDVNKEMFNQEHSPSSPPGSPPSSSVRLTECKETATDVQGKLSPVSVLEHLYTDDDSSPTTSTSFSSAGMRMQPLCIRFDEADSPKPEKDNNVKISMDDKELTLAYIEAIVKSAGLDWEELLTRPFYSEQILEPELTDDVVFCPTQLCDDKNLLYDCIDEVLMDFCWNEFNPGPWISFLKPEVQLISDMEIAAKVAREGVYWHLLPLPSPHTLDQIVEKDMARPGSWMDLRFEIGCLGSYTSEIILDELVEEIIMSCRDIVQVETMQEPNSDNL
ncbi:PREDICTED: uncharacterized protein LOC104788425 [Camelina sativa]|uniref:Uncharacterized protein LOC104788425 n=1 Tax=Camelina sativa TaxID=90675 RepID=A0ABM0Z9U5_CAMSA|nr:PREDICTED: uncharacterized protein LOC104788425 [Camelina sativa]XP_010512479.1 PREDICTED: uncharacterized protein LOC104788425 [Camelina sativa]XP_010512480.1 PREDICTED: uncharacterized protein LOC104788425 [Camelina sativa]XP_010512481.1 PREDICTED: uncharacterized protein LOC104788425 [Camelina sativa]